MPVIHENVGRDGAYTRLGGGDGAGGRRRQPTGVPLRELADDQLLNARLERPEDQAEGSSRRASLLAWPRVSTPTGEALPGIWLVKTPPETVAARGGCPLWISIVKEPVQPSGTRPPHRLPRRADRIPGEHSFRVPGCHRPALRLHGLRRAALGRPPRRARRCEGAARDRYRADGHGGALSVLQVGAHISRRSGSAACRGGQLGPAVIPEHYSSKRTELIREAL